MEEGRAVYSLESFALQVEGPHGAPAQVPPHHLGREWVVRRASLCTFEGLIVPSPQDWSLYERVVLISTGIGITPFASVRIFASNLHMSD